MDKLLAIDVSGILDEETFHEYISTKLNFPIHYGFNLDAFYDCITDDQQSSMPETLIVEGLSELNKYLPELHDRFVVCLKDYAQEYPCRKVVLMKNSPSGKGIQFEDD